MRSRRLVAVAVSFTLAVAACSDTDQIIGAEWDLESAPDGTHLVLRIGVGSSTCNSLHEVDVTERADQVDIQARVREVAGDCTADLRIVDRRVTLNEPLDDRALAGCRAGRGDTSAVRFSELTIPSGGDCRDTLPTP